MSADSTVRALGAMAICALGATSGPAFAQALPSELRLTFTEPTGVVHPNENVPVLVTLTNTSTQPFVVDDALPNFGLHPSLLPTVGYYNVGVFPPYTVVQSTYASYTQARLGTTAPACAQVITTGCWPEYAWVSTPLPAIPALAPGASTTFQVGLLAPHWGFPPPPGTYSIGGVGLVLSIDGYDAAGHRLQGALNPLPLVNTCGNLTESACAAAGLNFSRTLVAVPEPGAGALLALGMAVLALRRKR